MKSCYASIDHLMLLDHLAAHIKDRRVLNLLGQYLKRTSEQGGEFWDYRQGISLGCPLSLSIKFHDQPKALFFSTAIYGHFWKRT